MPEDWERELTTGPWPFVTGERVRRANGELVEWSSRAHRKQRPEAVGDSTWWAPRALGWWIGVLFAVGSSCFALGAFPPYARAVGSDADDITFFVGSIFFTSAALLQYLEAAGAARDLAPLTDGQVPRRHHRRRVLTWEPARIDWWATTIQLVGTLLFNVSTFAALHDGLSTKQVDHRVWIPDLAGSICFLVASELAFAEVGHRWVSWAPRSIEWQITAANMVGSIAFGASAVAAYVVPRTEELVNASLANSGTFVGAVCFLGGAALLLPERVGRGGRAPLPVPRPPESRPS